MLTCMVSSRLVSSLRSFRLSPSYQPHPHPQPRPQPPPQPPQQPPPQPNPPQGPPPQNCSFLVPSGVVTAPGAASAGIAVERKAGWSAAETLARVIAAATASAEIFIILTLGVLVLVEASCVMMRGIRVCCLYYTDVHVGEIRSFSYQSL